MKSEEIRVKLRRMVDSSYPIIIGEKIFPDLARMLQESKLADRYALITDSAVAGLYGKELSSALRSRGLRVDLLEFPAGERNKNQRVWLSLARRMLKLGLGRDCAVIALGGGVAGDLAGLVAATYLRGVPLVQVPTSLLAMVDASIGGKVAVDLPAGKNLLGAFWQPKSVYVDLNCLRTLPQKHLSNGMAEAVKSGLIADAVLFRLIELKGEECLGRDLKTLRQVIRRSLKVKAGAVELDERETSGLRKILNYGHTFGHGLEALSGYRLLHGGAIALGMRAAGKISTELGYLSEADAARQDQILARLGFPARAPGFLRKILNRKSGLEEFFGYLSRDKKVKSGRVEMVLLEGIGRVKRVNGGWTVPVTEELLAAGLRELLR